MGTPNATVSQAQEWVAYGLAAAIAALGHVDGQAASSRRGCLAVVGALMARRPRL